LGFLNLMADPDRHVRKAAVNALSAVAHHKPQLVVGHLPALLPLLYDQTQKKPELVRTVDLGPFKHQVGGCGVHRVCRAGCGEGGP
jgi:cullin-associated NEDD8-dissociated protein 1